MTENLSAYLLLAYILVGCIFVYFGYSIIDAISCQSYDWSELTVKNIAMITISGLTLLFLWPLVILFLLITTFLPSKRTLQ